MIREVIKKKRKGEKIKMIVRIVKNCRSKENKMTKIKKRFKKLFVIAKNPNALNFIVNASKIIKCVTICATAQTAEIVKNIWKKEMKLLSNF